MGLEDYRFLVEMALSCRNPEDMRKRLRTIREDMRNNELYGGLLGAITQILKRDLDIDAAKQLLFSAST